MQVLSIQRADGANLIHLQVRPHHVYILEYSESLEPESWIEIDNFITSPNSELTFEHRDPTRIGHRMGFYRLRRQ